MIKLLRKNNCSVEELSDHVNVSSPDDTTKSMKRKNSESDDGVENDDTELEEMRKNDENSIEQDILESDFVMRGPSIKGIYIKRYRLKKPRIKAGQSRDIIIYDNTHACYFCGKIVLHIKEHLKTHKYREEVKVDPDFNVLRKLGDDRHNRRCLKKGEGEIILARRPKADFDVTHYGPCPDCREWVLLKGLKYHNIECTKHLNLKTKRRKKDLMIVTNTSRTY